MSITKDRRGEGANHHHHHDWLELRVFAPRDPQERTFVFDAATVVGDAALKVATAFGYAKGNHTFQNRHDEVLDRKATLAHAHVDNGELLELIDIGGGV
ncbi:hypothetical protein [Mycobacterium asiaticum]|uniref:Uncharacterized protein n=1 Tax=Mycobacterium asiaticum TaxID=1790 RepID=A0A1A3NLH4_MYCAS|nr:hypothetical protein [Mycobacterium asiaticum]OBK22993.1 hypothetical protein A5635_20380 [Mycobacterium asiaticum]